MSEKPPAPERRARVSGDRGMQRATVAALVVGLVLDALVVAVAAIRFEQSALLGALIGTALTLVIVVPTVVLTFRGRYMSPVTMAVTVLATWAGKMFLVIIVLVLVRDLDGVSSPWIGIALLVGAVCAVLVEGVLLARSRQPLNVTPPTEAD